MNAHFIDLEIILKLESKPWIVDKNNPNVPILKIEKSDFNLYQSGIYKSHGNKLNFNGKTFWLPNEFMNLLKIKTKKLKIDISNLGISMQEFLNPEVSKNIDFDLDMSIFNNVINTNDDIYIICSKNNKSIFENQILQLEEELKELGLSIKKYYFISETFYNKNEDNISYLKSKLLLQHLLGLKTDGYILTSEKIDDYNQITYYDDNLKSISLAKDLNKLLENLLLKTSSDIKLTVKDKIKNDDNFLIIKEYTHNKANKFNEFQIQLEYSNIVKSFENFNRF
jgi:hypothetical protein